MKKSWTLPEKIERLKTEIKNTQAIVIGAGAGLSTAAGLTYSGERFEKYFCDFAEQYGINNIYAGGFFPFPSEEIKWAWWARHLYFNRYVDPPKSVYKDLLSLVENQDYFVLITNVDHQFQRAGFDKSRLFYTQGDYGLFQSTNPSDENTYDNEEWVMTAMEAQGFVKDSKGFFQIPVEGKISMRLPSELIPKCPDDGSPVVMNLRSDDTFVEDAGWHRAAIAYNQYIKAHENKHVLYWELGVGANTPGIIKFPFWEMTAANKNAVYACVNYGEAFCPESISERSICIDGDIAEILQRL